MIKYTADGVHVYHSGRIEPAASKSGTEKTMAYKILKSHNHAPEGNAPEGNAPEGDADRLRLVFDCLTSHDITYVGIIQTLRAARPDLQKFPVPYVLSNCHNSLCAVGGTINSDDHAFGLSAAKKYGGLFVPPHMAVIHQYMREEMAGCGRMILGSDSHTRYGAMGTMGIGEGGGELVKQLLSRTYDIAMPEVVGVKLSGAPKPWVGPQDVALALIGFVFDKGLVKNKVLEFFGDGIKHLSMDYRNGIDVMTTETACLSSIWTTDGIVEEYLAQHGRADAYRPMRPDDGAYYSSLIEIDLGQVEPMIALPFHPSHVYPIAEVVQNTHDLVSQAEKSWLDDGGFSLKDKIRDGRLYFEQGVIVGCAGGLFDSICAAADILDTHSVGSGSFTLSVYPASQPVYLALTENGVAARLMRAGAVLKTAFCGPCFGAGEVPPHKGLSARHATRNFPNREGSKPGSGQAAAVALMDARSIAATAVNKGLLTAASEKDTAVSPKPYFYDKKLYADTVFSGFGKADGTARLVTGPGIRDWPEMKPLADNLLLAVAALITDPVTTTDELIPSGEASSYRSNPMALAEFTLSRKDPGYVARAKQAVLPQVLADLKADIDRSKTALGSLVYAIRPGDGSAREQAASCQRVLGGLANIAREYATKRYRSNLVNWGMLPFIWADAPPFEIGDWVYIPGIRQAVAQGDAAAGVAAYVIKRGESVKTPFTLTLPGLTKDEADIILQGGLINYYGGKDVIHNNNTDKYTGSQCMA